MLTVADFWWYPMANQPSVQVTLPIDPSGSANSSASVDLLRRIGRLRRHKPTPRLGDHTSTLWFKAHTIEVIDLPAVDRWIKAKSGLDPTADELRMDSR
jgi:hypothetical protein